MKLQNLLLEEQFKMFKTFFYFEFDDSNMDVSTLANIVRAVDLVAVVNNKSDKDEHQPRGLLLVKCVSTQTASETFNKLQELALKVPDITKFKFSEKHLETKEV